MLDKLSLRSPAGLLMPSCPEAEQQHEDNRNKDSNVEKLNTQESCMRVSIYHVGLQRK